MAVPRADGTPNHFTHARAATGPPVPAAHTASQGPPQSLLKSFSKADRACQTLSGPPIDQLHVKAGLVHLHGRAVPAAEQPLPH